jgi:hypothetical protein
MYSVGNYVPGVVGRIDRNHCGLPWVAGLGGLYMGVLQVGQIFIDAKTGKNLTRKQMGKRLNNTKFDYENRAGSKKYRYTFVVSFTSNFKYSRKSVKEWISEIIFSRVAEEKNRHTTQILTTEIR